MYAGSVPCCGRDAGNAVQDKVSADDPVCSGSLAGEAPALRLLCGGAGEVPRPEAEQPEGREMAGAADIQGQRATWGS